MEASTSAPALDGSYRRFTCALHEHHKPSSVNECTRCTRIATSGGRIVKPYKYKPFQHKIAATKSVDHAAIGREFLYKLVADSKKRQSLLCEMVEVKTFIFKLKANIEKARQFAIHAGNQGHLDLVHFNEQTITSCKNECALLEKRRDEIEAELKKLAPPAEEFVPTEECIKKELDDFAASQ